MADSLVEANLRGVDSHGVARLPHYLRRIQHGSINPRPKIRVEILGPAAARVDGDRGLGQLVMLTAAEQAIELARRAGSAWVAVANSSHCGALAYYGLRIAEAGMIGLVFTHVDPMVLPYGSREPFCGTNPICITAPRAADGSGDRADGSPLPRHGHQQGPVEHRGQRRHRRRAHRRRLGRRRRRQRHDRRRAPSCRSIRSARTRARAWDS